METRQKRKLLAALLSAFVSVLSVEVGLRLAGYSPMEAALGGKGRVLRFSSDPRLGYELTPGSSGAGWGTWVEVNSHGFRDEDYPLSKGERLRVVVLGDSITFGNDLAPEETYAGVFERTLEERGSSRPVDVLNLGVGGYDTVQEVAFLEHTGLAFEPDVVVLGFCVNDLGVVSVAMDHAFTEEDRANPLFASRIVQGLHAFRHERDRRRDALAWNSDEVYARAFAEEIVTLEDEVLSGLVASLRTTLQGAREGPPASAVLARRIPPRWYTSPPRLGRFAFALDRLAALSGPHGFRPVLLLIPYLDDEPGFEGVYGIVRHLAESRGIEVLEASERFRRAGLTELRIDPEDPVHPNAAGHELLAERLLEYAASLGWLPPH